MIGLNQWNKLSYRQCKKMIKTRFKDKYYAQFQFYLGTSINHIVFNHQHSLSNIDYKDSIILSDDCQYLKRIYTYYNNLGKIEIQHRLSILAEFYNKKTTIGSAYPTMLITDTKKIFMKRYHRKTKTQNPDDTSNNVQSEQSSSGINQLAKSLANSSQTSLYLKTINSQDLSNSSQIRQNQQIQDYDLEIHNIYQIDTQANSKIKKKGDQHQLHSISFKESAQNLQNTLKHLICDSDDFDVQQTLRNYAKYKKSTINQSFEIDNKNNNKTKLITKISIEPIEYRNSTSNNQKNSPYSPYSHNPYINQYYSPKYGQQQKLTKNIPNKGFQKVIVHQNIPQKNVELTDRQKWQKKKKIREKAVELLGINKKYKEVEY